MKTATWKSRMLASILVITILLSGCTPSRLKENQNSGDNANNTSKLTEKYWIEDIDYMVKELPKKHINLYHSLKEETFKSEVEKLKNDVHKLKDYEIQCRMAQIIALVGDAHTTVNLDFGENIKLYPVQLRWFGEDLRIVAIENSKKDSLGLKLKYINSMSIEEVMKKINTLISHENNQWLKVRNTDLLSIENVVKALGIVENNKLELSLEDGVSTVKKVEIESCKRKDNIIDKMSIIKYELKNKHIGFLNNDKPYWYKYIAEDKILYLQYNQCYDYDSAKQSGNKNYESYPKFNEFSNEFLNELNNNEVDRLIVDLRNNAGGTSALMRELVEYIHKIDKLKGEGKIITLIGKITFSSGVNAAVDFKEVLNATLIGESTGGVANGYGLISSFNLPNSRIEIEYPTKYIKSTSKYDTNVIPDIEINETFENYKKGIDEVYEAAKNYKIKH